MDEVVLASADQDLAARVAGVLGPAVRLRACTRPQRAADALAGASVLLLDGAEPCPGLLEAARHRDVPVLVLVHTEAPGQVGRWLDAGAADCLPLARLSEEGRARVAAGCRARQRLVELQAGALVDGLTGAYNRRFLQSRLAALHSEAQRYRQPLAVLLLDLDRFKCVNDELGHLFGDRVLAELAELVQRRVRREDLLARYGGEEFALLLPHTEGTGAAALGERVRHGVAEHVFTHGGRTCRITVSVGGAAYPADQVASGEELLGRADERLYRVKEAGRNGVLTA